MKLRKCRSHNIVEQTKIKSRAVVAAVFAPRLQYRRVFSCYYNYDYIYQSIGKAAHITTIIIIVIITIIIDLLCSLGALLLLLCLFLGK